MYTTESANLFEGLLLKIKSPTPYNTTKNFWFAPFDLPISQVHLSLTSNFSDISTMTPMAPNSEHSQVVLKSSVSFNL